MSDWLFDTSGNRWSAASVQLREHLVSTLPHNTLCDFAVRNLGFARLRAHRENLAIWIRPRIVGEVALGALLEAMHELACRRVAMTVFEADWQTELVSSRRAAVARITQLLEREHMCGERSFRRELLSQDAFEPTHTFRKLVNAWDAADQGRTLSRSTERLLKRLNGRVTRALVRGKDQRVELIEFGSGYEQTAQKWIKRSEGFRVEDQVDYAYGCWIADTYRNVARQHRPEIDTVNVTISWPDQGEQRYAINRAILPFKIGQDTLILSASEPTACRQGDFGRFNEAAQVG